MPISKEEFDKGYTNEYRDKILEMAVGAFDKTIGKTMSEEESDTFNEFIDVFIDGFLQSNIIQPSMPKSPPEVRIVLNVKNLSDESMEKHIKRLQRFGLI